jgi:RHS repeat-associated protein
MMYAEVQSGSMDDAEEAVKLEVPDVHTRVFREHTDPVFRNRLRATIVGGVITVTPTSQGGGGRPGFLPSDAYLTLAAVYVYDAFNRRVAAALVDPSIGQTRFHVWNGWQQVSEHTLDMQTWRAPPVKQFVWGRSPDELVSYRRLWNGGWQTYFLLHGGQDTAAALASDLGSIVERYEHDSYGRISVLSGTATLPAPSSTVGLPFLWKGVRCDEVTGLLQMRHRYYSSELGRFMTADSLGVWGDHANSGNEYAYAGDRPLVWSDPMGLCSQICSEEHTVGRPMPRRVDVESSITFDQSGSAASEDGRYPDPRDSTSTTSEPKLPRTWPISSTAASASSADWNWGFVDIDPNCKGRLRMSIIHEGDKTPTSGAGVGTTVADGFRIDGKTYKIDGTQTIKIKCPPAVGGTKVEISGSSGNRVGR